MKKQQKKVDENQLQMMTLNLAHLLFLHGLVKKLYESKGLDVNMSNFLHDLLIMLEIYTDTVEMDEKLKEKFNYEPLNNGNDEKKEKLSEKS